MQASRFAVSQAAVALIGNAYAANKVITLGPATTAEPRGCPLPVRGCHIYQLELTLSTSAGSANVTPRLCHDLEGDHPFWEGTATAWTVGTTTATILSESFLVDKQYSLTSDGDAGQLYLFLKTNAGTITLEYARLNFVTGTE